MTSSPKESRAEVDRAWTYRESAPDQLPIHKLIADQSRHPLALWHSPQLQQPHEQARILPVPQEPAPSEQLPGPRGVFEAHDESPRAPAPVVRG